MAHHRMSSVGRAVLSSSGLEASPERYHRPGPYPFWSPSDEPYRSHYDPEPPRGTFLTHKRTQSFLSEAQELKEEVQALRKEADRRSRQRKDRQIITQLNTIMGAMQSTQQKPQKEPTPYRDERFDQVLGYVHKQQETLSDLVRSLRDSQYRPQDSPYKQPREQQDERTPVKAEVQSPETRRRDELEERYLRIKNTPGEFTKLLKELSFNDDHSETFINGDPSQRFSPELTLKRKAEILARIRNERLEHEKSLRKAARAKTGFDYVRLLRIYGWVVYFFVALGFDTRRRHKRMAEEMKVGERSIEIYMDPLKSWVLRTVRVPLASLMSDTTDFDIVSQKADVSTKSRNRMIKLKVHVRGFLDCLSEHGKSLDYSLRLFIEGLITNGKLVPSTFLSGFEKSRVDRDQFGALRGMELESEKLMIGGVFLTRMLVKSILMRVSESGRVPPVKEKSHL